MSDIAKRNDKLRANIPYITPPNKLLLTRGVADLPEAEVKKILDKVKHFDNFTKDNDPYGEHDFGAFTHNGEKFFWKIDDYNGHNGYELVLTVMYAHEY